MIFGTDELLKLVHTQGLVENLSERELNNPEGAGFDLRVDEVFTIKGSGILGVTHRDTPEVESIAKYEKGKTTSFTVKPGEYVLVKTMERVKNPKHLAGFFVPRSTLFRSGLTLFTSVIDPGYEGPLTFGMKNMGPCDITIELGARICQVFFHEIKGDSNTYRGQWQGGRVTTEGVEKQV